VSQKSVPKTFPDYESAGAVWVSADELEDKAKALKFRSASEPLKWIPFIAKGGKPKPLCIPDEHKELFKDVRL